MKQGGVDLQSAFITQTLNHHYGRALWYGYRTCFPFEKAKTMSCEFVTEKVGNCYQPVTKYLWQLPQSFFIKDESFVHIFLQLNLIVVFNLQTAQ